MSEIQTFPSAYWVTQNASDPYDRHSATLVITRKGRDPLLWSICPLRFTEVSYNREENNFDWEPQPSDRTDEYLKSHRFETAEEAIEVAKKIIKEGVLV